ncbi:MAG: ABC transporter ATP-binding protein [Boseongicola sp.]|nr:ABC transporter ATP-binding protein [Boseongicola sp.]
MSAPYVLEVRDVIAGYAPDLPILQGVSVHVDAGEVVSIIGPNGSGKSTLVKAIAGLVRVSAGEVRLDGRDVTGVAAHELAAEGVGYVPQTGNVFATLTVRENLVIGGAPLAKAAALARIGEICTVYPILKERMHDKAGSLSGGQRQILAVARALLTKPRLMLLDEPTASLSPMAAGELFEAVRGLAEGGAAVLMVEQNAKAALRVSDRGYVLAEGRNRVDGPAAGLLADEGIGEIFLGFRRDAATTEGPG